MTTLGSLRRTMMGTKVPPYWYIKRVGNSFKTVITQAVALSMMDDEAHEIGIEEYIELATRGGFCSIEGWVITASYK